MAAHPRSSLVVVDSTSFPSDLNPVDCLQLACWKRGIKYDGLFLEDRQWHSDNDVPTPPFNGRSCPVSPLAGDTVGAVSLALHLRDQLICKAAAMSCRVTGTKTSVGQTTTLHPQP